MQKILLVDTSYLIYRSFFASPSLMYQNQPTGAFFGFVRTILSLLKELTPDSLVFAVDLPEPTWRHVELVGYKSGRKAPEDSMLRQIPYILEWCNLVTPNVFWRSGFEADDIIATVCQWYVARSVLQTANKHDALAVKLRQDDFLVTKKALVDLKQNLSLEITVLSADRDLYQLLVHPEVKFWRPTGSFGGLDFEQKYGLSPHQWLDCKALTGDSSDNIPGAPGIGPKTAVRILQGVGHLYHAYGALGLPKDAFAYTAYDNPGYDVQLAADFLNQPKYLRVGKILRQHFESVSLAYRLSKLSMVPDIQPKDVAVNLPAGVGIMKQYGLDSLLPQVESVGYGSLRSDPLF